MYKWFGYDVWCCDAIMEDVCQIANDQDIALYNLSNDAYVTFSTKVLQRKQVLLVFPGIRLLKTTGIIGLIFLHYKSMLFYIRLFVIIGIYVIFQSFTFRYQIVGVDGKLKQDIVAYMQQYTFPVFCMDENVIFDNLRIQFMNRISWLEVYKDGVTLNIHFSEKKEVVDHVFSKEPLYATKDAVIVSFDILHGTKKVNVHDFVRKGSVLVDGYLVDSFSNIKEMYVKGKVYGYTWYTIEASLEDEGVPEALMYFRLLFACRNQVSVYISNGEKIVKESILHFSSDEGTIRMLVHYTLLEDITIP